MTASPGANVDTPAYLIRAANPVAVARAGVEDDGLAAVAPAVAVGAH